jgi:hypothetical protein
MTKNNQRMEPLSRAERSALAEKREREYLENVKSGKTPLFQSEKEVLAQHLLYYSRWQL